MGYRIVMECGETEVLPDGTFGYHAGARLPIGHPDVNELYWRPVIETVEDEQPAPPPAEEAPSQQHKVMTESSSGTSSSHVGVTRPSRQGSKE